MSIDRLGSMDALRSQMRKWTPQQLQAFAMQHQNDAIALSLISQEQSEREKARASQQAMGQPQQPKVNQQVIGKLAQLPEEVGIGQLPAQNLEEGMADGGIVGYADGGLYETPYDRMNRLNREAEAADSAPLDEQTRRDRELASRIFGGIKRGSEYAGRAIADIATIVPRGVAGAYDTAVVRPMRAAGINAAYLSPYLTPEGASVDSATPFTDIARSRDDKIEREDADKSARWGREVRGPAPAMPAQEAPSPEQKRDRDAGLGGLRTGAPTARAGTAGASPDMSSMAGIKALQDEAKKTVGPAVVDPEVRKMLEETEASRAAQAQREVEDVKARESGLGALMKSREERIAAREGRLGAQEESDKNMAIIRAGLALASSTKKGFLSAVAEGATAGVDDLLKSKALTKAERQKIEDARDAMETLRFDQDSLTRKEKTAALNKIDEVKNLTRAKMIDLTVESQKVNREQATHMVDKVLAAQEKAADRASHEKIAGMQVAAMRERAVGTPDKQRAVELKAIQTNLMAQIKELPPYGAGKLERAKKQKDLDAVNAEIARMARLDTISGTPGAAGSGGSKTLDWASIGAQPAR